MIPNVFFSNKAFVLYYNQRFFFFVQDFFFFSNLKSKKSHTTIQLN